LTTFIRLIIVIEHLFCFFFKIFDYIFGTSATLQGRLSIRPGDMIDVEYLDQYASGGRKAIQVRGTIEVGRGVFCFVKE
jgi:hypothetical protein